MSDIETCPHLSPENIELSLDTFSTESPLHDDSWVCLKCADLCTDMASHRQTSTHPISLHLETLKFWCHHCDSYINSPTLLHIRRYFQHLKYGTPYVHPSEENSKELQAAKAAHEMGGMYAVDPKRNCPHIQDQLSPSLELFQSVNLESSCVDCAEGAENWVCLTCGELRCSRYINEHNLYHALETNHTLGLSLSDLSFWCYQCESYIVSGRLRTVYALFSEKKFGEARPRTTSAHPTEEEKREFFDDPEELDRKISVLAEWVQECVHGIIFTGAGVSTSTGIPDYRSGANTVLGTGPGIWERKELGGHVARPAAQVDLLQALPSQTHMSFVELMKQGLINFLVSQNVDGLHRRSGVPTARLSELHGNTNVEKCRNCTKEYMRDYETRTAPHVHLHETGRKCDNSQCRGELRDSIINFGENLDSEVINKAMEHAQKADFCLAMGSSLRVTPASLIPQIVGKKHDGRLVIVNLQKTPLDSVADLRIFAMCDVVMQKLMQKLGLQIPEFRLERRVKMTRVAGKLLVEGCDLDNTPFSLFTSVEVGGTSVINEPFEFEGEFEGDCVVKLVFHGNYDEPDLLVKAQMGLGEEVLFKMEFDPSVRQWGTVKVLSRKLVC